MSITTLRKFLWGSIFILIIQSQLFSQENIGLTMDNYSGIMGAQVNPALMTQNKTFFDVNLVGLSFHFSNNFAYIPRDNPAFFGPFPIDTVVPTYGDFYYNGYYTYYKNHNDKWMTLNAKLMGPSFMFQYNNHAFGFSTALRTATSGVNFPWEIPVFVYEDLNYEPLLNTRFYDKDFGFTELVWEEMSFSYAYELQNVDDHSLSFGITTKLLFGLTGFYNTYKTAEYRVLNQDSVYYHILDSELGYSVDEPIEPNPELLNPFKSNGFGIGFDLGVVYVKKKNDKIFSHTKEKACAVPYQDYIYRIGFSLIDLGSIKFKKSAGLHHYYAENVMLDLHNLPEFDNMTIDEYLHYISDVLTGDPDSSYVSNTMTIGLPSAATLQADWHINEPFYLSFLMVQPLHFRLKDVKRTAQIAVTPRYETRLFGVSLPVSLINYSTFRTGLSLRFYSFVVGTESLGTLLDLRNLDNLDVYVGFKFNLNKGKCDSRKNDACSYSW